MRLRECPNSPEEFLLPTAGEIVARVARTATALGLETVAVAVHHAVPRFLAQEVTRLHLIEQESSDFYLNMENLIALAKEEGCDALHPGYGFLAENAAFAEKVTAAGLTWIGPAAKTIAQMGDKHAARQIATEAKVCSCARDIYCCRQQRCRNAKNLSGVLVAARHACHHKSRCRRGWQGHAGRA